ncbi:SusC/RagA family TonB-linked outer membrane protein [Coprobacter tertius]|uniref:TonB-dependent receptor n=1 Tax=Coprobacter tertius TaxID=2944915 RepID=A0ABT1MIR6_9BACT|nr:TonB-dependent receptor [Coprobacter tertius]MCP9612331.1 TonB-dependent receptor [Coprobacter tertius]
MEHVHLKTGWKMFLTLLAGLFFALDVSAQKITVQGTVKDQAGEPVTGANVIVKGETHGTMTDIDGHFRIDAPGNGILTFSFIGYTTKDVPIENRTQINVILEENVFSLGEVVAIGYGTVKKSDATGAVTTIKPDEVNKGLATSAQDLLVGATPGVVVTLNGGKPEGGGDIRIRGGSSLNATNDPLIVIDGVPVDNSGITGMSNALSMIPPDNIESFTILKDASATAIYGSRASNGVIIITTKKGTSGRPQINFNANVSVNTPRKKVGVYDASEFRGIVAERYGMGSQAYALLGNYNTNWQDEILRTTVSSDYNLSVGGQYKILPYRVSVTYTNQNGILKTSSMNRTTASITLTPKFFNNTLSVTANVKGMYIRNQFADENAIGVAPSFDPTQPVKVPEQEIGNGYFMWLRPNGSVIDIAPLNPASLLDERSMVAKVYRSVGNLQLDYVMPFLPELRANLNLGYDVSKSNQPNKMYPNSPITYKENKKLGLGQTEKLKQFKRNELLDFYLNYKNSFDQIRSDLDVMAGYSWQRFYKDGSTNTTLMPDDEPWFYSSYADHLQLLSFFGRINYTFKNTYLLTFTLRGDATSRFSKDHRWGTFPSVALGWKIINEPFMQRATDVMNELKLRLGYGVTGQQDISNSYFPYLPLYSLGYPTAAYPFGDTYYNTLRADGFDPDIKWEETTTYNIGLDFGFLNNTINGSIDYYYRKTNDLISQIPVPAGSNLTNEIYTNIGSLRNEGIEFSINAKPIVTNNVQWDVGFNIAWNSNKITKLNRNNDPDYYIPVGGISGGTGNTVQAHKVGYPAFSYLLYEQVYDKDGKPIEGLYVDRNGDGIIDENDKRLYKSRDPKVIMSFTTKVNFYHFDFSLALRANLGNYVYDNVLSNNSSYSAIYNSAGYLNNLVKRGQKFQGPQYMSDYYLKNAGFLRCDHITLGYTWDNLLKNKMNLRLYGAVQNPFVITKYKGLDPEVFSGIDNNVYPRPTTYMLGVILTY